MLMSDRPSISEPHPRFGILVVDDDAEFRALLHGLFREDHRVALAASGDEALELAPRFQPDVVLMDIHMPGIDGFETCRRLKSSPTWQGARIVMISADSSWEQQLRAFREGADDYAVKPIQPEAFFARIQLHLQLQTAKNDLSSTQSQIRTYQLENAKLVETQAKELVNTQDIMVFTLAEVVDSRDETTGQHLLRMRAYAAVLAERLRQSGPYQTKIDRKFIEYLYRSSPLHDIGKVGIPDSILLKPGPLTSAEWELMKQHTVIGANILDAAVFRSQCGNFLAMASVIARFHHERWDGTGYPAGLIGEEIPLPARIVAVADVFDALTSKRPYRKAISPQSAKATMLAEAGTHFDPAVVAAFREGFDDFRRIHEGYREKEPFVVGAMAFVPNDSLPANPLAASSLFNF
jgi:response regulator RpfG family c-di-GMP phosphodiesterase